MGVKLLNGIKRMLEYREVRQRVLYDHKCTLDPICIYGRSDGGENWSEISGRKRGDCLASCVLMT